MDEHHMAGRVLSKASGRRMRGRPRFGSMDVAKMAFAIRDVVSDILQRI